MRTLCRVSLLDSKENHNSCTQEEDGHRQAKFNCNTQCWIGRLQQQKRSVLVATQLSKPRHT